MGRSCRNKPGDFKEYLDEKVIATIWKDSKVVLLASNTFGSAPLRGVSHYLKEAGSRVNIKHYSTLITATLFD